MRVFRLLFVLFRVLPSRAFAFDRTEITDAAGASGLCQKTRWQFPAMLLRRGGWLLLVALATLAFGAMDASAYDLSAGGDTTCALDDNGVTCSGEQ